MRFSGTVLLAVIFIASCGLANLDDEIDYENVDAILKPDAIPLSDESVYRLTIENNTDQPIWYNPCGQIREVSVLSGWKAAGAWICYKEMEGIQIGADTSFDTETMIRFSEPGAFRLKLNIKNKESELLPPEVRTTNSVRILEDRE
jgi:hypothetical protein